MIIMNIKLINYRKFRNQFIEFPEGIIGIVGKNGVGKSTIFEAIGWALYGNIMSRSDKEEIKSQNAQKDDTCRVELEFRLGSHNYKTVRELRGSGSVSSAFVFVDGKSEPEAVRDSGVNQYIENLLGVDYVTFMRSVYARQKDLASLSALTQGERQRVIRRMLNVDRIDSAIDSIRADKRGKESYVKGIRGVLVDVEKLKEQKKNLIKEMKAIEKDINRLMVEKDKISKDRDTASKEKEEQEECYSEYNELKNTITKSTSRLEELKKRNSELIKEKERLQKESKVLRKLIPKEAKYFSVKSKKDHMDDLRIKQQRKFALKKSTTELLQDIKSREESIKNLKQKLAAFKDVGRQYKLLQKQLKELKQKEKEVGSKSDRNIEDISICKSKIDELVESKREIKKLGPESKCPRCYRKLGKGYDEILKHLNQEVSVLQTKFQELKKEEVGIRKQKGEIEEEEGKLELTSQSINTKQSQKCSLEEKIKTQQEELSKQKNELAQEKAELNTLAGVKFDDSQYYRVKEELDVLSEERDKIISLKKEISRLPSVTEELKSNEATIRQEKKILGKNQRFLADLKFDIREYNKAKEYYEKLSEKFNTLRVNLEKERGYFNIKQQEFRTVRSKIKEQRAYRKQIETTEVEIQYLLCLETILIDFRNALINRIRPLIEVRASHLFKELTDCRYPLINLDENYNIYIVDENQPYGLERFSGGEEDLANLCLRIAMSQVIAERSGAGEINFLAIDEIFGSQDEDRRKNILNAFYKLSNQFKQIILVTHIEPVKEILPCVLKVEEDGHRNSHAEFELKNA